MSRWIRWRGLIAFVVFAAAALLIWLLVVDTAIKRLIEKTGTKMVGAKVELAKADLSFFPLGLTLTGLQITDPDAPMTNAAEVRRIAFLIDSPNLLRRKLIVEEVAVDGVRLNTPRKTSGAVKRSKVPQPASSPKEASGLDLPSLDLPSAKDILAKEELQSIKLVESVRGDLQSGREKWEKQMSDLPDKEKWAEYRNRIQKLKSSKKGDLGSILGGSAELAVLRKDIDRDLDRVKAARKNFDKDRSQLKKQMDAARKAPQDDARRLLDKYPFSAAGVSNMGQALFGNSIGGGADRILKWHQKLKPVLERASEKKKEAVVVKPLRAKGVDVRYREHNPLPDFLIRKANVSVEIPAGTVNGEIRDITPDQNILGRPTRFRFAGDRLKGIRSIELNGELNHVNPSRPLDRAGLRLRGYSVENRPLSKSEKLPIVITKASVDLDLRGALRGEALDAGLSVSFKSAEIRADASKESNRLARSIASALSDVTGFQLGATIAGTVEDYRVKLSSDLDRVLREAVVKQIRGQTARLEEELRAAISEKVGGEIKELEASFAGWDAIGKELAGRLDQGNGLLKGIKK